MSNDYDGAVPDGKALAAFETYVRSHPMYSLMTDHFLRKLEAHDSKNPEFIYKTIDSEWQMFLRGYETARAEFTKGV